MFNASQFNDAQFNSPSSIGRAIITRGSFHAALANFLYPEMIERERRLLYGEDSRCTLFSVSSEGEQPFVTLTDFWSARRIRSIESPSIEEWRLEITNESVNWKMIQQVSTVLIEPDTGEVQRYKVMQAENAMKPGYVYQLRIEAIDQT